MVAEEQLYGVGLGGDPRRLGFLPKARILQPLNNVMDHHNHRQQKAKPKTDY